MRGATMSLLGLYNFDNTVLDPMQLPADINRTILLPDLLSECAEFEILYPEPQTFKTILAAWSGHRVTVWQRMCDAAKLEYNPIENYDRMEEWTDEGSGESSGESSGETKMYKAGYNPNVNGVSPALTQQDQTDTSMESSSENSGRTEHSGRTHGNIGVTTSQQMLQQELSISDALDIYKYIIQDFKNRFCIPLY